MSVSQFMMSVRDCCCIFDSTKMTFFNLNLCFREWFGSLWCIEPSGQCQRGATLLVEVCVAGVSFELSIFKRYTNYQLGAKSDRSYDNFSAPVIVCVIKTTLAGKPAGKPEFSI